MEVAGGVTAGGEILDTNVQKFTLSNAGSTLNVWETETPLSQGPTVSESLFISQQDIDTLRANPGSVTSLFHKYGAELSAILGPAFSGLTQEGLLAVFTSVAAYQLGPYRAFGDPSPAPTGMSLPQLLTAQKYVCNEYVELAIDLFDWRTRKRLKTG